MNDVEKEVTEFLSAERCAHNILMRSWCPACTKEGQYRMCQRHDPSREDGGCDYCQEEFDTENEEDVEALDPWEGKATVRLKDVEKGEALYEYLLNSPFGTSILQKLTTDDEKYRFKGYLGILSDSNQGALELVRKILVEQRRVNPRTYERIMPLRVCAIGAQIANILNYYTGERGRTEVETHRQPFTIFPDTEEPWSFFVHFAVVAPTRRGKGVAQVWTQSLTDRILKTKRFTTGSLPGLIGGIDRDRWETVFIDPVTEKQVADGVEGANKIRRHPIVPGKIRESADGIVQVPEGRVLASVMREQEGKGELALMQYASDGEVDAAFLKGSDPYHALATFDVCIQTSMFSKLFGSNAGGFDERFVFAELEALSDDELDELEDKLTHWYSKDPLAADALRYWLYLVVHEFYLKTVDPDPLRRWTLRQRKENPEYGISQPHVQRYVAVGMGYALMTLPFPFPETITLPNPNDEPRLRTILLREARVRSRRRVTPHDQRVTEFVQFVLAGRSGSELFGIEAVPIAWTRQQFVDLCVSRLGWESPEANYTFYGEERHFVQGLLSAAEREAELGDSGLWHPPDPDPDSLVVRWRGDQPQEDGRPRGRPSDLFTINWKAMRRYQGD